MAQRDGRVGAYRNGEALKAPLTDVGWVGEQCFADGADGRAGQTACSLTSRQAAPAIPPSRTRGCMIVPSLHASGRYFVYFTRVE